MRCGWHPHPVNGGRIIHPLGVVVNVNGLDHSGKRSRIQAETGGAHGASSTEHVAHAYRVAPMPATSIRQFPYCPIPQLKSHQIRLPFNHPSSLISAVRFGGAHAVSPTRGSHRLVPEPFPLPFPPPISIRPIPAAATVLCSLLSIPSSTAIHFGLLFYCDPSRSIPWQLPQPLEEDMEGQNNYGGSYRDQASFWQFSDQLRLQTSGLSDLSIGDSIWSDCYVKQQPLPSSTDLNGGGSSAGWKSAFGSQKLAFGTSNYGVNRYNNADSNRIGESGGVKSSSYFGGNYNGGGNGVFKDYFNTALNKPINKPVNGNGKKSNSNDGGSGKKKKNVNINNNNSSYHKNNYDKDATVDKRFKTLPPSEALPRNEAIGGYIFVCNNDTMEENLRRQLFGTPALKISYRRLVDQVRVVTRKLCEPLEEDSFRPILHHYDGPKFRLELNVEEVCALIPSTGPFNLVRLVYDSE
ncbi:hypothetical protein B296_00002373 [Ensete ventricosum]|uniref:DCD domain-containing protein n=1 Tax=Ensete ventricosum TaxID=4639 RepID=A0A427B3C9_ENSVE|nr:hypothetical protein B296_00002373 [Ensete ventricosum]